MPIIILDTLSAYDYHGLLYSCPFTIEVFLMLNAKNVDRVEDCGNGFGWSIINWDDEFYGNCYEFAVLRDGALCYDSGVTSDVVRGDWTLMDKLRCMVEDLHPDRLAS